MTHWIIHLKKHHTVFTQMFQYKFQILKATLRFGESLCLVVPFPFRAPFNSLYISSYQFAAAIQLKTGVEPFHTIEY